MSTPVNTNVSEAKAILRGKSARPAEILALEKKLRAEKQFGYARRLLSRALEDPSVKSDDRLELEIRQKLALCTYKDPDLPADMKLDRALEILREAEDLAETRNQETLGLAGAIYKRMWEVDNQKAHLERALFYYLRGYGEGAERDQGYTGINAAFILDLLANQEEKEARRADMPRGSDEYARIEARRARARAIREEIVRVVAPLSGTDWLTGKWWFYSTVAEAYFGLGPYDETNYGKAVEWLKEGRANAAPPEWEYESTARQLAELARLQAGGADIEQTPAWRALGEFLGHGTAAVRSAFAGKIGLGLSGGGFRASLYHIGVLAKLAELDVLRRVEVLSCVSGGSVIGAHYYLEVRKLLQEKADSEITREDYIEIVKRVQKEFLRGVQRNVRTRVLSEPITNLRMIFTRNYSRTLRAGELFESEIFSLVPDGGGRGERFINDLYVKPKGEPPDFRPKYNNWRREAKVPILILNAATLNTGHSWHFTASYMGEPPAGIDSVIDGNDRLRRVYYTEAPERHRRVRLGHAVAASACVPGLFEPVALEGLYPDRVVRLVDGGVCDNQGITGLLEQDCNVLLISDGSGQMESLADPSRGPLGTALRSTTILQSRVRQSQYQDMVARKRSGLLRGFMFVHLKEDLNVDPVDWVGCLEPYDASDDARPVSRRGKLTSYGIARDIQQSLASVRTDLDSFSDVEAYALMASAYRMTEHAFAVGKCVEGVEEPAERQAWEFLAVEAGMIGEGGQYEFLKWLLGVSNSLAFKIWKLSKGLRALSWVLAVAFVLLAAYAVWRWPDAVLVKAVTLWGLGVFVVTMGLTMLATAFVGKTLMRIVRLRETLIRMAVGAGFGIFGWLAAWLHLHVFDKMFLKLGSLDNFRRRGDTTAGGLGDHPAEPLRQT